MAKRANERCRLADIILDEKSLALAAPELEHERKVAIFDLLEENHFDPAGPAQGPFTLKLAIVENRLVFDIHNEHQGGCGTVKLPLAPFRTIIRDYIMVCESYFAAVKSAPPSRIEAIDVGRRSLHDEGAGLLRARLDGKIELDFNTARRLFTLICVLHWRR